ncbi:glycoside hydrolase [candidate division KSB1 bacterium]|nr:glycoside hydrolase [candidate division KSB1 bacterium]
MRPKTFLLILLLLVSSVAAQSIDPSLYQDLRYRNLGPFRAGRTVGAVGVPAQPNVFYIGVNNGGVWKTDDYGRTWKPIFDEAPTGSVGDIAVSPSQPEVIYVGAGEGLHRPDLSVGDGIFKSTDGGKTWAHVGLADVQQVGRLIVHPTNPDIVFVAGLGHPYGPNEERGVFRTTDGGRTWQKVLYINPNTGAIQVEFDPTNPQIIFADLWEHREGPWENGNFSGTNSGLYKSTDGGDTWRRLTQGLPTAAQGLGRIGAGIAPSNPKRMYATVDARENGGIYRSDDTGESWVLVSKDRRLWGRGSDFAEVRVHPKNPDIVFIGNIASYRADDGGRTWTSIKGAPGGDDYHRIWINPLQPDIMLFATDQGATVTVNGGRTWSSWYNQPTAQLYHVITDNQFPYWVYGGQQESGAIAIASRGNGGQISFRDWIGVGADEYAYVAPDPMNPDIVYGGRIMRFNKKTGQAQNVAPEALRSGKYRILRTMPLLFHSADPTTLLFATNVLWKTNNGGEQWQIISPDLSREQPEVPESIGDFRTPQLASMPRRGVIYAVAPSPRDVNTIWAGTDDGLVHVTRDGGTTWKNVTPPELRAWDKVSQIDAGHFDVQTAYIAINAIRRDDMRPHIYRTHDGGTSWTRIVTGLPEMGPVNVVHEDPKQPGLLFAGTERTVYFSMDDGGYWQSLRMNMPASSIRDLVIHENDLVIGTHGRSIWILDNFSPLREMAKAAAMSTYLFAPTQATRVRWNMFSDTPLPPEEPAGQNPPDGAILDYYLSRSVKEVRLEIVNGKGETVRRFVSSDKMEVIDTTAMPHPTYWIRPPQVLTTTPGHHRFVWNLRHIPPPGSAREFAIAAVYRNTPSAPGGPFVHPGRYAVRLTVDGTVLERPLDVRLDPRVNINAADLQLQTDYSLACYNGYLRLQTIRESIDAALQNPAMQRNAKRLEALQALRGSGLPGNPDLLYGSITAVSADKETIVGLQNKFLYLLNVFQSADVRPTQQTIAGVKTLEEMIEALVRRWEEAR